MKLKYYLAAIAWLWRNRSWKNTRQKWKAMERYLEWKGFKR